MDIASRSRIPRRQPGLLGSSMEGDLVVLDERTYAYHHLNPTASAVWELIDGEQTVAQIAAALTSRYEVTIDQCLPEVLALIDVLVDAGLAEWAAT